MNREKSDYAWNSFILKLETRSLRATVILIVGRECKEILLVHSVTVPLLTSSSNLWKDNRFGLFDQGLRNMSHGCLILKFIFDAGLDLLGEVVIFVHL